MYNKIISFSKKDIFNLTKENMQKYFMELDPLYIQDGPKVKKLRTFKAKSLTPYEEKTHFTPIVQIGENKYISIEKVQSIIAS
ncbi:MAG: hypothetical protein KKA19_03885 [Candidatus Margulisbacteria bacterium]|nr:hypothetical protein [Candidatus Margulisiibacteriota bacterium]